MLAAATASASATPQWVTTFAIARSMVSALPASVPSARRGTPAPCHATASVTRTTRPGPLARKAIASAAGCTWTRSAMSETAARSSVSAAPTTPGSRWCSGGMPLKQWVTSRAPASNAAAVCSSVPAECPTDTSTLPRCEELDRGERAVALGRQRHDAHDRRQRAEPREVRRADQLAPVRARSAAEERALEVGAGDRRPRRRRLGDPRQAGRVVVERRGHERRAPRRHALREQGAVQRVPVGPVRRRHVHRTDAVDLEVDEARCQRAVRTVGRG